jgi:hypothetical protein
MVACPKCRHSNSDGSAMCLACGFPLPRLAPERRAATPGFGGLAAPTAPTGGGGFSPAGGGDGMEEFNRMMAARAAKQKRSRMITGAVVAVALVGGGGWLIVQKRKTAAAQVVLEAGGRFAERDKTEMGSFWNCVTSSDIDVGSFQSADQIQQRIESAYFTQQKTFSEHITSECVPKIERARSQMSSVVSDMPPDMREAGDRYVATLPKLQGGIETYAERIKGRGAVKDVDQTIQEVGTAFSPEPSVESVAFEKFLVCAIPELDKKKDVQGVLEFLATTCKADALKFMSRVREQCGPLVQNLNKDAKPVPGKTFKVNAKKFYEEDQRQLQAWEYCAKRSRKGKKVLDLEEFLTASGDYLETRSDVVRAAREAASRITGTPLEAPAKKPGAAPAE